MIDFWIAAATLLLVALAFLLLPVVRGRRQQAEEDRTALNVALYQERLAELDAQFAAGTLEAAQLEVAKAEAARELLEDTEADERRRAGSLGRALPLVVALALPLVGVVLYQMWGSSDKLALTREFASQPQSVEQMIDRLERAVAMQPDNVEAWYVLGRSYMTEQQPAKAAGAFARAVDLAGPQPELLGQWAQSLYFAGNRQWTEQLGQITAKALEGDPNEPTTLGLLGIAGFEAGRYRDAATYWGRLVALLPPDDPSRQAIQGGVDRALAELEAQGEPVVADQSPAVAVAAAGLTVQVELASELQGQVRPDDAVFVFVRAESGPPMPLAVKRLTVADLPATVSLGDADAMTPQLRLSNFRQVRVAARISRSGNASQGEWKGQGEPLELPVEQPLTLVINQPDAS